MERDVVSDGKERGVAPCLSSVAVRRSGRRYGPPHVVPTSSHSTRPEASFRDE